MDILDHLIDRSWKIENGRTVREVYEYGMGEMEELLIEVDNFEFDGVDDPKDGIAGEGVDVALCTLDATILHMKNQGYTKSEVKRYIEEKILQKLDKWERKYSCK